MANVLPPPLVFQAAQQVNPDWTPQEIIEGYQQAVDGSAQKGIDITAWPPQAQAQFVLKMGADYNKDPSAYSQPVDPQQAAQTPVAAQIGANTVRQMDPNASQDVSDGIGSRQQLPMGARMLEGGPAAAGSSASPDQDVQQVQVQGIRPQVTDKGDNPNQVRLMMPPPATNSVSGAYDGSGASPVGFLDQYNPQSLVDASRAYKQQIMDNNTNPGREFANIFASGNAVLDGGALLRHQQNEDDRSDTAAYATTVGLQKNLQEQATAGVAAAKSIQDQLNSMSQQGINVNAANLAQTQARATLLPILQDANARTPYTDPSSKESQATRNIVVKTLVNAGFDPKFAAAQIPNTFSGVTALQALGGVPGMTAARTATSGANLANAQAGNTNAQTPGTAAISKLDQAAAKSNVAPDGSLVKDPYTNQSLNVGPLSIQPNQSVLASQGAQGQTNAQRQQSINAIPAQEGLMNQFLATIAKPGVTGKGAPILASLTNGDQARARQLLMQLNKYDPTTFDDNTRKSIEANAAHPGAGLNLSTDNNTLAQQVFAMKVRNAKLLEDAKAQASYDARGGVAGQFGSSPEAAAANAKVPIMNSQMKVEMATPGSPKYITMQNDGYNLNPYTYQLVK